MYFQEQYDLFLAYYGDRANGTESAAHALYRELSRARIPGKPHLRVYFHPVTNPEGIFEETPMIVARTPLFLLVIDKGIPRTPAGQMQQYREDGRLRNLYEEVRSFHNSNMYKEWGGDNAAKLYIADGYDFKLAEQLHPMFSGKTAVNSLSGTIAWIAEFYSRIYPKRQFLSCRTLLVNNRAEFERGLWCAEAEQCWRSSQYEPLGRLLLSYYASQAQKTRSRDVCARGRRIYQELQSIPYPSPETASLLSRREIEGVLYY